MSDNLTIVFGKKASKIIPNPKMGIEIKLNKRMILILLSGNIPRMCEIDNPIKIVVIPIEFICACAERKRVLCQSINSEEVTAVVFNVFICAPKILPKMHHANIQKKPNPMRNNLYFCKESTSCLLCA